MCTQNLCKYIFRNFHVQNLQKLFLLLMLNFRFLFSNIVYSHKKKTFNIDKLHILFVIRSLITVYKCIPTMIKYIDDHLSLNMPRYLTEVSVRLLYTYFMWAFVLHQRNLLFTKSQYERPHKIRVQQTYTYFGQITEGR